MPPAIWFIVFAFPAANHEAPLSDTVGLDTNCTLHPIVLLFEATACIPPIGMNHTLTPSPTLEDGGDGGSSQRESRTCRERRTGEVRGGHSLTVFRESFFAARFAALFIGAGAASSPSAATSPPSCMRSEHADALPA